MVKAIKAKAKAALTRLIASTPPENLSGLYLPGGRLIRPITVK
jgi:hypothetical protein